MYEVILGKQILFLSGCKTLQKEAEMKGSHQRYRIRSPDTHQHRSVHGADTV